MRNNLWLLTISRALEFTEISETLIYYFVLLKMFESFYHICFGIIGYLVSKFKVWKIKNKIKNAGIINQVVNANLFGSKNNKDMKLKSNEESSNMNDNVKKDSPGLIGEEGVENSKPVFMKTKSYSTSSKEDKPKKIGVSYLKPLTNFEPIQSNENFSELFPESNADLKSDNNKNDENYRSS